MANEPSRLSTIPPAPSVEADYDAICAAVLKTARGRWFLDEYARRRRDADIRRVLEAVERIERAIQGGGSQNGRPDLRIELLEMARTIAQARADVAEIKPEPDQRAQVGTAASAIDAAAERLQDLAWTMREHGLDMRTCEQIETLASTILSASSLRDPSDRRAQKLSEVLRYLERRIDGMLDSNGSQAKAPSDKTPSPAVEPADGSEGETAVMPLEYASEVIIESASAPLSSVHIAPDPAPNEVEGAAEVASSGSALKLAPLATPTVAATPPAVEPITPSETAPAQAMSEAELADFLLRPLPTAMHADAAEPPATAMLRSSDITADIEEELFETPPVFVPSASPPPAAPTRRPAMPQPRPGDPFAALKALSDEERIALFT
jgi:hypothetical protein